MGKVQLTRRVERIGIGSYMGGTGWYLAMRRIDMEFDIPQFVAAALVRRIATNDFKLPASERRSWDWFAKLPDSVIARCEQIVREAFQQ
ncbi:hypothetical protein [Caballeronia sp. Lep1P3]|uniref:hypothetical protein n=1 Tax=Burkholderiaceae TaxID=119060 RepID=UPI001FD5BFB7|nr:hypothetical protein [Caballeronia sp. Lep1P3]